MSNGDNTQVTELTIDQARLRLERAEGERDEARLELDRIEQKRENALKVIGVAIAIGTFSVSTVQVVAECNRENERDQVAQRVRDEQRARLQQDQERRKERDKREQARKLAADKRAEQARALSRQLAYEREDNLQTREWVWRTIKLLASDGKLFHQRANAIMKLLAYQKENAILDILKEARRRPPVVTVPKGPVVLTLANNRHIRAGTSHPLWIVSPAKRLKRGKYHVHANLNVAFSDDHDKRVTLRLETAPATQMTEPRDGTRTRTSNGELEFAGTLCVKAPSVPTIIVRALQCGVRGGPRPTCALRRGSHVTLTRVGNC